MKTSAKLTANGRSASRRFTGNTTNKHTIAAVRHISRNNRTCRVSQGSFADPASSIISADVPYGGDRVLVSSIAGKSSGSGPSIGGQLGRRFHRNIRPVLLLAILP